MNRVRWVIIGTVIVMVFGTALAGPVQAREPDRQDAGYIISYQTEVIFPAVISFSVALAVEQTEIESVALSVFQRDELLSTITLDLDEHVLRTTEFYTQMVYRWALNSADAPAPFEPINYRWEIVTQDEIVSIVSDELNFDDQARGPWRVAGRLPLVLHWANMGLAGETMRDDLLPVYALLEENTRQAVDFEFVLYESNTRYCQEVGDADTDDVRLVVISRLDGTEFPCSEADFETFYADTGFVFLEQPNAGFTPTLGALAQYMTLAAYAPFWEDAFVSAWFRAGIGFVYRPHAAPEMLSIARNAARLENLLSIEDLSGELPDTATYQQQDLWNAQSYLLVLYLIDRFGADAVFDLARTAGNGDFEGTLFELVDGDDRVLWDKWYHWLLWEEADAAVTWTPYTGQAIKQE